MAPFLAAPTRGEDVSGLRLQRRRLVDILPATRPLWPGRGALGA